jgi:hypothetical protein
MAASKSTVAQIVEVILRHVPKDRLPQLLTDLRKIQGNESVLETIRRVALLIESGS